MMKYKTIEEFYINSNGWKFVSSDCINDYMRILLIKRPKHVNIQYQKEVLGKSLTECEQKLLKWANDEIECEQKFLKWANDEMDFF